MKSYMLIPAIFLSLTAINALADAYSCQKITGQLSQLTPDSACHILSAQSNHFPDSTFVPNACFSGKLTATLGNNSSISGTSYSGLTNNSSDQLTAVSSIELYNGKVALGKIYTKDIVVIDPKTNNFGEILTMVGGSNTFNGGHGELEIVGNALYQAVNFTGIICIEKE